MISQGRLAREQAYVGATATGGFLAEYIGQFDAVWPESNRTIVAAAANKLSDLIHPPVLSIPQSYLVAVRPWNTAAWCVNEFIAVWLMSKRAIAVDCCGSVAMDRLLSVGRKSVVLDRLLWADCCDSVAVRLLWVVAVDPLLPVGCCVSVVMGQSLWVCQCGFFAVVRSPWVLLILKTNIIRFYLCKIDWSPKEFCIGPDLCMHSLYVCSLCVDVSAMWKSPLCVGALLVYVLRMQTSPRCDGPRYVCAVSVDVTVPAMRMRSPCRCPPCADVSLLWWSPLCECGLRVYVLRVNVLRVHVLRVHTCLNCVYVQSVCISRPCLVPSVCVPSVECAMYVYVSSVCMSHPCLVLSLCRSHPWNNSSVCMSSPGEVPSVCVSSPYPMCIFTCV